MADPTFLGRPFTPAEIAIVTAQTERLETGILNNPLLPRDQVGSALVTLPFFGAKA